MALSNGPSDGVRINVTSDKNALAALRDGGATKAKRLKPDCAAVDWLGEFPARTPGNEGQAFSVARAGVGLPVETKKARSVVALSRVPR
ncbi:hypothetical protein [Bradyrhizobium sp. B120]|uniref:hypothetical protein n=1 Tax=Bradyrhizobium sp. B120 TaxID=3410088 RepID=UPI003B98795E